MSAEPDNLTRDAYAWYERLLDCDAAEQLLQLETLKAANPELLAQVRLLLDADALVQSRGALSGDALQRLGESDRQSAHRAGDALGPYRLERPLGTGGMGEVWLATRQDGVTTAPVAVKMLHPHLAQSALRGRFAREGKILGQLAHPNIARLLDAGITPAGRMYLVLEHVEGERIDDWCDHRHLGIRARIELFLQVCEAAAHAHANLVVHRDLKPSNILVGDGGVIKLLDFGIAKLIETDPATATDPTELTRLGGRVLTPEYAAPEQIMSGPITIATDVYSLGVLLYLLLTGRRPLGEPGQAASQVEREVLENEPRPASQARPPRDSQLSQDALAAERDTSARRLRETLRGDLDTIIGKALKKSPRDRYASLPALAEDLQRYLDDQPVLARPDAWAYRARKYLRRHRATSLAVAAVTVAVLGGLATTFWQAQRAEREAAAARAETVRVKKVKDFFVSVFTQADPMLRKTGQPPTLSDALDTAVHRIDSELGNDPSLQSDLLDDFGEIVDDLGDGPRAKAMFQRALPLHEQTRPADDPSIANTLVDLGTTEAMHGHPQAGLPYIVRAVAILEKHADTEGAALANARMALSVIYDDAGDSERSIALLRQIVAYYEEHPDPHSGNDVISLSNLGVALLNVGRYAEALAPLERGLAIADGLAPNSMLVVQCLIPLSSAEQQQGDLATAATLGERALAITRENFPDGGAWVITASIHLGLIRIDQERIDEGEQLLRDAESMSVRTGVSSQRLLTIRRALAGSLRQRADLRGAFDAVELLLPLCTAPHVREGECGRLVADEADLLVDLDRPGEGLAEADRVLQAPPPIEGEDRVRLLEARARALDGLGRDDEAIAAQREACAIAGPQAGPLHQRSAGWHLARLLAAAGTPATISEAGQLLAKFPPPAGDEAARAEHDLLQARVDHAAGRDDDARRLATGGEAMLHRHLPARALDDEEALRFVEQLGPAPTGTQPRT